MKDKLQHGIFLVAYKKAKFYDDTFPCFTIPCLTGECTQTITSYVMLPPEVAGCRRDACDIEPDADKIHISRLLCCMNIISFWATSCWASTLIYYQGMNKEPCWFMHKTPISAPKLASVIMTTEHVKWMQNYVSNMCMVCTLYNI